MSKIISTEEEEFEKIFNENLLHLEANKGILDDNEKKVLEIVQKIHGKNEEDENIIPEPTPLVISTKSGQCCIKSNTHEEEEIIINLGNVVKYITQNMFEYKFEKNKRYPIQGLKVGNLIIRYDEIFLKKNRIPCIKYKNKLINPLDRTECYKILENIEELVSEINSKKGRQKKSKKDDEDEKEEFYNTCSIYLKPSKTMKTVNIKLFLNGEISLAGCKMDNDGELACQILLNEIKRYPDVFMKESISNDSLYISNTKIKMINSDFNLRFEVNLNDFMKCINQNDPGVFTILRPERHRGLRIFFYWNLSKTQQNGICECETRCNGKGTGEGVGNCKKVSIFVFKSGKVIVTGGKSMHQLQLAYDFVNSLVRKYYKHILRINIEGELKKDTIPVVDDETFTIEKAHNFHQKKINDYLHQMKETREEKRRKLLEKKRKEAEKIIYERDLQDITADEMFS
jgi:TATA-box binding protein (TBP) (component of TFIID and TFIIIB)